MVIYLDAAFALNALADAAALYAVGRLTGRRAAPRRLLAAAVLGGVYGAACLVPVLGALAAPAVQLAAAAVLVYLTFGRRHLLRLTVLLYAVSCAMGGAVTAAASVWEQGGAFLMSLNWPLFFLTGGGCFLVLSLLFRGEAAQAAAGRLLSGRVERSGKTAPITALYDTGHALTDGGIPVLTVCWESLAPLWTGEERRVLAQLAARGPVWCMEQLGPGFRLLPYRAVGVSGGLLLCCAADRAALGGRELGRVTLALSPEPLGTGWDALWGGEERNRHAAEDHGVVVADPASAGICRRGTDRLHRRQRHPAAAPAKGGGAGSAGAAGRGGGAGAPDPY